MSVVVLFSVFLVREILEVRRQQTFIDSVTHELKSPLASIKLCLDTLARRELSESQRENLRHMMLADVERLSTFVNDILEASRISHGLRTQQWSTVNVMSLVQRCIEVTQRKYELDDAAITAQIADGLTIHTDPTAFETVLKNLLDNAVKYSTPPPRVTIEVRSDSAKYIRIEVQDQGIGIPESLKEKIFHMSGEAKRRGTAGEPSFGLGLGISKQIVESNNGNIWFENNSPGGASFFVSFPVAESNA